MNKEKRAEVHQAIDVAYRKGMGMSIWMPSRFKDLCDYCDELEDKLEHHTEVLKELEGICKIPGEDLSLTHKLIWATINREVHPERQHS